MRLKHSYNSDTFRRMGESAEQDIYREASERFDLIFEYDWVNDTQLVLELNNLTQENSQYYYGSVERPLSISPRGRSLAFELRKTL